MAHLEQKEYCLSVKERFPDFFQKKLILDIGALDINGNNQYLFDECGYWGVDISPGRNIDIVSKGHELNLPDNCFDLIISTECFEHDPFYARTIKNIYRMLKPGGLFIFSCATTGRPEHGTRRTTPDDAPFIQDLGEWADYYKNLEEHDIRLVLDVDSCFKSFEFSTQNKTHDLYFWGVKTGDFQERNDYSFLMPDNSLRRLITKVRTEYEESEKNRKASEDEINRLESTVGKLQSELEINRSELKKNRTTSEDEINKLESTIGILQSQLELSHSELKKNRTTSEDEINKLESTIGTLQSELELSCRDLLAMTRERDAAVWKIGEMHGSTSWRITAPIRFAGYLACGNFGLVAQLLSYGLSRLVNRLPQPLAQWFRHSRDRFLNLTGILPNSRANFPAIATLVDERCDRTRTSIELDPMCPPIPIDWPAIDISIVTYNSQRWIDTFVDSLLALEYPKDRLTVRFIDNNSTDGTESALQAIAPLLQAGGFSVEVIRKTNRGFGAGHNAGIRVGNAPFCLISNIDLTFESSSLKKVVAMALADASLAAAWELRQKPYEHPKFYDPITGTTNWNAHACVLLRRSALEAIGGYDETLFMYAEDVELSYRLRRAGHLLRYCPQAVVWHYSYQSSSQIKPLQYIGSTFGNLYLRLKYGKLTDIVVIPLLALRLLVTPETFPGSRLKVARSLLRLLAVTPKALLARRASIAHFPFRTWDYELIRDGAFVEQQSLPTEQSLVSIITRTYRGRELYLRQALMSGAHQTWSNLEHIVVEDGGDTMRDLCEEVARTTGRTIRFIANSKCGRSKAGNTGMFAASGRWCVFLDDDDLLFPDHVEVLANALLTDLDAVASYTPAWDVVTDTTALAQGRYIETTHNLPKVLHQEFDYVTLQHHNCFAIQSVLFERRLFEERGGFDEDMDALEDWLLWIRYARDNHFVYVPKVTSMFRTPANPAKAQERAEAFSKAYPLALIRAKTNRGISKC